MSKKALQIAEERREVKGKGERERYPTEGTVSENSKGRQEGLLKWIMQKTEEKIEWEKLLKKHFLEERPLQENWRHQGKISSEDGHNKRKKLEGSNRSRRH